MFRWARLQIDSSHEQFSHSNAHLIGRLRDRRYAGPNELHPVQIIEANQGEVVGDAQTAADLERLVRGIPSIAHLSAPVTS